MHAQEVAQEVLAPQEHASWRKWKCYVFAVYPQEHSKRKKLKQGLEGYSRDPGFDQNTVRDSGKRKTSWRDLTATREAGFTKFGYGMRDFVACLSAIREIVTTQKTLTAAKANQPGERQISIERANLRLKFISFCRN